MLATWLIYHLMCGIYAHSSGDLMRINFTVAYIQYSFCNLCSAKLSLVIAQEGFVSAAAGKHEFITFV